MKLINQGNDDREVVARFGAAELVRLNGKHELVGGTTADWTAAKEWVALFEHDLVIYRELTMPRRLRQFRKPGAWRFNFSAPA